MKCLNNFFARVGLAGVVGLGLTIASDRASSQIITLLDNNSMAQVDIGSSAGMFNWSIQMPNGAWQNQLNQQWFWYRIGNTREFSIDSIAAPVYTQASARQLSTTYGNNNFSVSISYLLSGGLVGSGVSDIQEVITIRNLSATTLSMSFFQYSDFNLQGTPGGEVVQLGQNFRGLFNEAVQVKPGTPAGLTETVTTPGANRGEVGFYNSTLAKLQDANPDDLNNNAGPTSPLGNVTWALQWNLSIAPGGSIIINKDKYLNVPVIPEPTGMALLGLGALALVLRRRK